MPQERISDRWLEESVVFWRQEEESWVVGEIQNVKQTNFPGKSGAEAWSEDLAARAMGTGTPLTVQVPVRCLISRPARASSSVVFPAPGTGGDALRRNGEPLELTGPWGVKDLCANCEDISIYGGSRPSRGQILQAASQNVLPCRGCAFNGGD